MTWELGQEPDGNSAEDFTWTLTYDTPNPDIHYGGNLCLTGIWQSFTFVEAKCATSRWGHSLTHLCIYTNTSSIFFCMKINSLTYLNSWLKWQFKGTLTFCSPPFKWTTVCLLITQKTPVRGFVEQLLLSKKSDIERTLSESDGWFDGWKKKERQPLCRQWEDIHRCYLIPIWETTDTPSKVFMCTCIRGGEERVEE